MWRPEEEIREDLTSGSAERVANGLRDLVDARRDFDEFPVTPPAVEIFESFSGDPPREALDWFVELMDRYAQFEPDLDEEERFRRMVEVGIRYGKTHVAFEVALHIKIRSNDAELAEQMLAYVGDRGVRGDSEVYGAKFFVSCLLDGEDQVRNATIRALSKWRDPSLRAVISGVLPELTDEERGQLGPLPEKSGPTAEADATQAAPAWTTIAVEIGTEWAPDSPWGLDSLEVSRDGRFRYENRVRGSVRTVAGQLTPEALGEIARALATANFPSVPAHPIPPGASLVRVVADGDDARAAVMHLHKAEKFPGYGNLLRRVQSWCTWLRSGKGDPPPELVPE